MVKYIRSKAVFVNYFAVLLTACQQYFSVYSHLANLAHSKNILFGNSMCFLRMRKSNKKKKGEREKGRKGEREKGRK